MTEDVHLERDKQLAPYLLAASFSGFIEFNGSYSKNGILYWRFSPKNNAELLVEQFHTRTAPSIQAKDFFDAIDTFWKTVANLRNGENSYASGN